ncbi:MAG: 3-dehydroquinate synthase II [Nitrososphaeraceae archaeon]
MVSKDKKLIPVTEIKIGDEIVTYAKPTSGRHFGMQVNEFILEK